MSPEVLTIASFVLLIALVLSGFPTALAIMGAAVVCGLIGMGPAFLHMIPQRIVTGTLSIYIFAAVPLFIFMGTLLERAGIAERCYGVMYKWLGGLNGGLAVASVLICTLFAATTGVIGASVTTMGLLAIPAMIKRGYDKPLASGAVCAGGSLGQLIPPSVMLIMYAPMAGVSVVQMFEGAILPGLLLSTLFCTYIIIRCRINPNMGLAIPVEERESFWTKKSLTDGLKYFTPPIFIIVAVLGTIITGIASATEAGAMGVVASLILMAGLGRLKWQLIKEAALSTLLVTSMVILIAISASLFTGAFLGSGCGFVVSDFLLGLGLGKWGVFVITLIIITILGMFIDWIGVLYILVPIFGPILLGFGFDPLWTGLVICIALQMSFLTPPFAYAIFYLRGLKIGLKLSDLYRGIIPFVILQAIGTILCIVFPQILLWLPAIMYRGF